MYVYVHAHYGRNSVGLVSSLTLFAYFSPLTYRSKDGMSEWSKSKRWVRSKLARRANGRMKSYEGNERWRGQSECIKPPITCSQWWAAVNEQWIRSGCVREWRCGEVKEWVACLATEPGLRERTDHRLAPFLGLYLCSTLLWNLFPIFLSLQEEENHKCGQGTSNHPGTHSHFYSSS